MASIAVRLLNSRGSGVKTLINQIAPRSLVRFSQVLVLTIGLTALSGCATTLEHYQTITQSIGSRIDAVVSPAIDAFAKTRFITGSANALDRLNNKLSWIDRNGDSASNISELTARKSTNRDSTSVSTLDSRPISIAPSRCFDAQSGNSETTQLKTTARLRLRNAPSVDAVTIRIIDQGTDLTARRVTCGNWTEIVRGEKPIGFVFSAFLTAPSR